MDPTNLTTTGKTNFRVLDQYREESSWADEIGKTYHFPKKYLKLISQPNTRFIYHEPKKNGKGEYFGCGEIGKITPDPAEADQFFADILSYRPFTLPVSDSTEQGTPREQGPYYNAQNAVRKVAPELFSSICSAGGVASIPHEAEQTSATASESLAPDPVTAAFQAVCSFCRDYPTDLRGGLPTGDPKALVAKENLRIIADWLHGQFPEHKGNLITVRPTAGAGAFPRVPWVCLLTPGQEVTKGIYVGICFGMEGAGLVAGCMRSVANKVQLPTVTRTGKASLAIDVGDFNNAYANPLEIRIEDLNQQTLLDHVRMSLDLACNTLAPKDEQLRQPTPLSALLRRYQAEQIIFCSSAHQRRYAVASWDQDGVHVDRLDGEERARVTFSQAERLISRVQEDGALEFSALDNTAAVRNTVLQAEPLALTGDRTHVRFLPDNRARLENFLDVLDHINMANPLYKPAMLLCVLDGLDDGSLSQNRIPFDWAAPRFVAKLRSLGKEVSEREAAQPFFHLSSDLFWLHAVQNTSDLMQSGSQGPAAARSKIKYALLKDTYWNLLQDPAARSAVRQKLLALIGAADGTPEPPPAPPESIPQIPPEQILKDGLDAVEETGFLSPPGQIRRLLTALTAKPFVILTGNSGTGKTKLAQLIAHWLTGTEDSNHGYAVVPVGADWTDNRNVVGYVNHLRKPDGQNPIYQSAPVLDLLLRAKANPDRPYFLILDEMNLSHVERYFSDFLSAMESKKPVPLHNEKQPLQTAAGTIVHKSEPYPDNLFVIGTVNVDETTYMFSPKVLDRANVLEFRIGPDDAKGFLAQAATPMLDIALATPGTAESFLLLSRRARGLAAPSLDPLPPASLRPSQETLQHLFALLQSAQLEFAFRTITEIIRYLHADYALAADKSTWDWKESLDAQLLQKVLPKLHGSRRRLEAILVALTVYCENRALAAAQDRLKKDADLSSYPPQTAPNSVALPLSRAKLIEMIEAVRRDQFVSFIQ